MRESKKSEGGLLKPPPPGSYRVNDILFSIDQGGGEILVLLDLSSAFDTIDHAVLFDLWHDIFEISGTALSLLKSYLHDRTQCVQIDGIISEYAKLVCGVPQGSVLGP